MSLQKMCNHKCAGFLAVNKASVICKRRLRLGSISVPPWGWPQVILEMLNSQNFWLKRCLLLKFMFGESGCHRGNWFPSQNCLFSRFPQRLTCEPCNCEHYEKSDLGLHLNLSAEMCSCVSSNQHHNRVHDSGYFESDWLWLCRKVNRWRIWLPLVTQITVNRSGAQSRIVINMSILLFSGFMCIHPNDYQSIPLAM